MIDKRVYDGDKLTAFAPHTTGILLGTGKELEIAKQRIDAYACLVEATKNLKKQEAL